jgi:hypothetical protein
MRLQARAAPSMATAAMKPVGTLIPLTAPPVKPVDVSEVVEGEVDPVFVATKVVPSWMVDEEDDDDEDEVELDPIMN